MSEPREPLTAVERAILRAVRAGAEWPMEVVAATGFSLSTVIFVAGDLVEKGLLCALDGEPWAICGWPPELLEKQP